MNNELFVEHRSTALDMLRRSDESLPLGSDILNEVSLAKTPAELVRGINKAILKGTGRYRRELETLRDIVKAFG